MGLSRRSRRIGLESVVVYAWSCVVFDLSLKKDLSQEQMASLEGREPWSAVAGTGSAAAEPDKSVAWHPRILPAQPPVCQTKAGRILADQHLGESQAPGDSPWCSKRFYDALVGHLSSHRCSQQCVWKGGDR